MRYRFLSFLPCLAALLLFSGCGTGDYQQRLENRVGRLRTEARFLELYAPQDLAGTPVAVRVPQVFKDSPLVEGAPGKDGNPIDPRRVKPTVFDLPWLKLTYELMIDQPPDGRLPFYCYVGAVAKNADGAKDPNGIWTAELAGKGGQLTDWSDFQAETPGGQTVAWKKLRFEGPQEFFRVDPTGQEAVAQMPGVLEIYLREDAGQYIVVAWRTPTSIEQQAELAKWAPLVAGCVTAKP
jgi:hypothetical protein